MGPHSTMARRTPHLAWLALPSMMLAVIAALPTPAAVWLLSTYEWA